VETLDARGATAVIPPKSNRKQRRVYDEDAYAWRHLIENYFAKIKEFRALATRYESTASSYAANWHLAATIIAGR
jgi:transposase